MSFESSEPSEPSEPAPLDWRHYRNIPNGDDARKVYEADLVQLGYNEDKVRQFLRGKNALARDLLRSLAPKSNKKKRPTYRDLRLDLDAEDTVRETESEVYRLTRGPLLKSLQGPADWVVFDPFSPAINEILRKIDKEDLPLFIKLAFYKPQNDRYLEYNTVSKAIRMKSARNILEGQHFNYTLSGVVLKVDDGSGHSEIIPKVEIMDTDAESDLD